MIQSTACPGSPPWHHSAATQVPGGDRGRRQGELATPSPSEHMVLEIINHMLGYVGLGLVALWVVYCFYYSSGTRI